MVQARKRPCQHIEPECRQVWKFLKYDVTSMFFRDKNYFVLKTWRYYRIWRYLSQLQSGQHFSMKRVFGVGGGIVLLFEGVILLWIRNPRNQGTICHSLGFAPTGPKIRRWNVNWTKIRRWNVTASGTDYNSKPNVTLWKTILIF